MYYVDVRGPWPLLIKGSLATLLEMTREQAVDYCKMMNRLGVK